MSAGICAPISRRRARSSAICYYGESVLLPELRGSGLGREFMARRERYARSLPGVRHAAFCADVRGAHPAGYRPLDGFWESTGFRRVPGLVTEYSWKEVGEASETPKQMQFWMEDLEETK